MKCFTASYDKSIGCGEWIEWYGVVFAENEERALAVAMCQVADSEEKIWDLEEIDMDEGAHPISTINC